MVLRACDLWVCLTVCGLTSVLDMPQTRVWSRLSLWLCRQLSLSETQETVWALDHAYASLGLRRMVGSAIN